MTTIPYNISELQLNDISAKAIKNNMDAEIYNIKLLYRFLKESNIYHFIKENKRYDIPFMNIKINNIAHKSLYEIQYELIVLWIAELIKYYSNKSNKLNTIIGDKNLNNIIIDYVNFMDEHRNIKLNDAFDNFMKDVMGYEKNTFEEIKNTFLTEYKNSISKSILFQIIGVNEIKPLMLFFMNVYNTTQQFVYIDGKIKNTLYFNNLHILNIEQVYNMWKVYYIQNVKYNMK